MNGAAERGSTLADVSGDDLEHLTTDQRDLLRCVVALAELSDELGRKMTVKIGDARLKVNGTKAALRDGDEWVPLELDVEPVHAPRDQSMREEER